MYKGISLHIGVNKLSTKWYRSEGVLSSPGNDARAMAELARHEGYSQVQVLTDEDATRDNFKQYFLNSANALNAGDTFLITFSGHGGQREDTGGDELDGKDETWCFYDTHLLDDEIGSLWKNFKAGVRIIVVSASCHSRSALKPYPISLHFWQEPAATKSRQQPVFYVYPYDEQIKASILHISACDDRQQARDGDHYSNFTGLLLKTWNNGSFNGSYEALVTSINRESGYLQTSGVALMGNYDPEFLNSKPFKLLTNKP